MGMTDLQFKDFLRGLMDDIQGAKDEKDKAATDEKLEKMLKRFRAAIED